MKFLVILLISLFAAQHAIAADVNLYETETLGIKDEFQKIIDKIEDLINSIWKTIESEVNKGIEAVTGALETTMKLVLDTYNTVLNIINKLQKDALDMGLDISLCLIEEKLAFLYNMKEEAVKKVTEFAQTFSKELNKIKDDAFTVIEGYLGIVQKLASDFKNCSIINPICLAKVLAEAVAEAARQTIELPKLLQKIIVSVANIIGSGVGNMVAIGEAYVTSSWNVVSEIRDCINDKVKP